MKLALLVVLTLCSLCLTAGDATTVKKAPVTLEDIRYAVDPARCNSDAQCKSIGIGSRPCGGPDYYMAWSTTTGNARVLFDLASRYREQQRVLNEKTAMASTCDIQRDPGAFCSDPAGAGTGRCAVRPRDGLGSSLR